MSRRFRRRWLLVAVLASSALGSGTAAPFSGALLGDQVAAALGVSTGTVLPPTGLTATGGLSTSLAWTAGVTAGTSGYEVWRGTTSGGSYGLVTVVSPGSATSGSDAPPAPGTYYYVLRSILQNWRSVDSNEASATIVGGPTTTGYVACGSNAADSGGDGNGYETAAADACLDDLAAAVDANTGTAGRSGSCSNAANDRHRYGTFGLPLPGAVASIDGIEIRADLGLNNNGGTSRLCVELSWDGGASWTAASALTMTSAATTAYVFGGPADLWGRSWSLAELGDGVFLVRVTDATTQPNKDYRLEFLAAQVTYTP